MLSQIFVPSPPWKIQKTTFSILNALQIGEEWDGGGRDDEKPKNL